MRGEQTWGDYLEFRSTSEGRESFLVLFGVDYAGRLLLSQGGEEVASECQKCCRERVLGFAALAVYGIVPMIHSEEPTKGKKETRFLFNT